MVAVAAAMVCATALARRRQPSPPPTVKLELYSQSESPSHAQARAAISVARHRPEHSGKSGALATITTRSVAPSSSTARNSPRPVVYPSLPEESSFARDPTPLGADTFWYPDGSGHYCLYQPDSVLPCYTLTTAGGQAIPAVGPEALAASAAAQIDVSPGHVQVSPERVGVTGAASWFWLNPTPTEQTGTVSLAGETVTVDARPTVRWRFGDGSDASGAGVPYQPGLSPSGAVTHSYDTRCLPGDQGRDPNVLQSCGAHGYQVTTTVSWSFDYRAAGPVGTTGTLPSRSTSTGIDYPVSEVRAFLTGSSG
jgi:hypothetical protein